MDLVSDRLCLWMQDLYHELHALDRFRTDLKRKQQEEEAAGVGGRGGVFLNLLLRT